VQLTEVRDQNDILMIGGIGIFLPCAQDEAEVCVADDTETAAEQSQLTMTMKRKLEQTFETTQADEGKNERSKEWLNDFSQQAENTIELELTAEEEAEVEEEDEHSEEWLSIFSQEAEKNTTWDVAEEEEEEAGNIFFTDLWDQIEALEERVKVQGVHIQQVKLEIDEGGMGDHGDLLMCQKFLQLRRLQK
jgi:hypothetical protein